MSSNNINPIVSLEMIEYNLQQTIHTTLNEYIQHFQTIMYNILQSANIHSWNLDENYWVSLCAFHTVVKKSHSLTYKILTISDNYLFAAGSVETPTRQIPLSSTWTAERRPKPELSLWPACTRPKRTRWLEDLWTSTRTWWATRWLWCRTERWSSEWWSLGCSPGRLLLGTLLASLVPWKQKDRIFLSKYYMDNINYIRDWYR